ncbi:MAG: hypothetical protein LUD74_06965 [Tannerellaceae bacterium]|nr:hypothetical protein [Tannerellaceae bacterium]
MKSISANPAGSIPESEKLFLPIEELFYPLAQSVTGVKTDYHSFMLVMEGRCTVRYDSYPPTVVENNELFFIPSGSLLTMSIEPGSRIIVLRLPQVYDLWHYNQVFYQLLSNYIPVKPSTLQSLSIKKVLNEFARGVSLYLGSGQVGQLLYEIKIKEFLMILSVYYNKQELTRLLEPMLSSLYRTKGVRNSS